MCDSDRNCFQQFLNKSASCISALSQMTQIPPSSQNVGHTVNYFVSILREDPWQERFPPSCAALSQIRGEVWMDMENAASFPTPFVGLSLALGWSGCCSFSNGVQSPCKSILVCICYIGVSAGKGGSEGSCSSILPTLPSLFRQFPNKSS